MDYVHFRVPFSSQSWEPVAAINIRQSLEPGKMIFAAGCITFPLFAVGERV